MKKFLIVKTSSLGDIVHTYPVIDYLKTRFPDCSIDWVVEEPCADLVRTHPYVNKTFCVNTRAWRKSPWKSSSLRAMIALRQQLRNTNYDCVFDLQGNTKSAFFTFQARSPHKVGFARPAVFEWPNLLVTTHRYAPPAGLNAREEYIYLLQRYFDDKTSFTPRNVLLQISKEQHEKIQMILRSLEKNESPLILVCAGSAWQNKQMNDAGFLNFLMKVQNELQGTVLFAWGSTDEQLKALQMQKQISKSKIIEERLSLPTLQNLMDRVDLVIAMDSLPLHLAGTTRAQTFGIFGPSLAEKFMPLGENHRAFQGTCPYGRRFPRRCPILRSCPTGNCVRGLNGNEVYIQFVSNRKING